MTRQFVNNRRAFYVFVILLSAGVLGISANFASRFGASFGGEWLRFFFISSTVVSYPYRWLYYLCFGCRFVEHIRLPLKVRSWYPVHDEKPQWTGSNGSSQRSQPRFEILLLALFGILWLGYLLALHTLFKLIGHAKRLGRYDINYAPIREVPWFYEMPGYYPTEGRYGQYSGQYPQYPTMPSAGQPMAAAQQPQVTHITV
ncbi:hypothetical protein EST38_g12776 [Candolleomyces aberdarensis]|uniref:Uncharacterized protein n=1 Tax=Candolleomyces aberdarensis TaxID=2316362 RepID=A0A4V1Q1X2_9AGAR|nr:hypothetical protein EST38_g12776 [Candolleomyces aberdarensis]